MTFFEEGSTTEKLNKEVKDFQAYSEQLLSFDEGVKKHLKLIDPWKAKKNEILYGSLLEVGLVSSDEIREFHIYPVCPICGEPVTGWHYEKGDFYGCQNHFDGQGFFICSDKYDAANSWNNFVRQNLLKKYVLARLGILFSGILLPLFLDVDILFKFFIFVIFFIMFLKVDFVNEVNRKMDEEISKGFLRIDYDKIWSEVQGEEIKGNSNREKLENLRLKILNEMNEVSDAELKKDSIIICDVVRFSVNYLNENPDLDFKAVELLRRMEQFQEIIKMYLQVNKYNGNSKIKNQVKSTISDLKPVFKKLYEKLMEIKELDMSASLSVLQQDIKEFNAYHNLDEIYKNKI